MNFEFNRALGNAVTFKVFLFQIIKLDEDNKNNGKAKYFWIKNDHSHIKYTRIERFMERKGLTIRQKTGIGRKFYSITYYL